MTIIKDEIINNTMSITNREDLKEKIHDIHNYMRNNGIGYGLNSLKTFNVLYGLKKIQDYDLFKKVGLTKKECNFDYLLNLANDNSNKTIETLKEIVLQELYDNEILKDLLFYEIPYQVKDEVYNTLIKEINEISKIEASTKELLSGKIYEYFVGRDQTAISELGAYFTNRRIVDFILSNIDIKLNTDGSIPKMIDMFGGSGGFTTGYMNYLNDTYKDKINWESELNKIYHFDINKDVLKSAGLEFFCLSNGIIPDMNNNIKQTNSFTYNFISEKGFDLILTNPPYGGDKNTKSIKSVKRTLIKTYIQEELKSLTDKNKIEMRKAQLKEIEIINKNDEKTNEKQSVNINSCSDRILKFAKKYKLTGNDKEACSLMLMMDLLNENGKCVGVLKEGIFFDKKYKNLRECLIKNYNVSEVISVPQSQFENTSTKTSIIIFDNTSQKTTQIIFSELNVETYNTNKFIEIDNKIYLEYCKGDIKDVKKVFLTIVTKEAILSNDNISLNHKDYNKISIECGEDFKLVKIADICEFLPKSKRNASFGKTEGLYNFYTSSDSVKKCDNADYNEESIIIGTGGVANIKIDNKFSCSADNMIIKSNICIYIYNIIKSNIYLLTNGFYGSTIKHLSKDYLQQLEIPIPKSQELLDYWIDKISNPYNLKKQKEKQLEELENQIKDKILKIEECEEVKLGNICNINPKNIIRYNTNHGKIYGKYKFHTGATNSKYYCDEYNIEKYTIILNKTNGSGKCNIFLDKKISCAKQTYICQSKNNELETQYIYYYLYDKKNKLEKGYIGACHKNLSYIFLEDFKIKLPIDKSVIDNLQPLFNEIEELQKEIKEIDNTYNKCLNELSTSAIKNYEIFMKINEVSNDIDDNEEKQIEVNKDEEIKSVTSSKKSLTVNELKEQCKSLGIKGYSKKKKDELIEMINKHN
jgi:type I restriction-modification system DNA methylase subunit